MSRQHPDILCNEPGPTVRVAADAFPTSALVFDQEGQPLKDCSAERAASLVQRERAVLVSRDPLAIRLTDVAGRGATPTPPGILIDGRTRNARKKRRKKDKRIDQLKRRDGLDCFYCGRELLDDCTIEHLLSQTDGGNDKLANLALTHVKCNGIAADLSVVEKVKLRDRLRTTTNVG